MIAALQGTVARAGLDHLVIQVGGVGLLVHTTPAEAASHPVGQEAWLATTLVVREESLTLFGFGGPDERDLFEQVQTVSGVGPRLALAMLAVHPPIALRTAIGSGDVAALTKVPGIGKKGAERIVLELKDKVAADTTSSGPAAVASPAGPQQDQVVQALEGLGWSAKQAGAAVAQVGRDNPDEHQVAALLRLALRELGR